MLSWSEKIDLKEIKEEISQSVIQLIEESYEWSLMQYIPNKRIELNKNKILLFEYCGPV